jgi:hypothetical protein
MAMAMHTRIAHPLPGHCRSLPLPFQLSFIAIAVALLIACGRFCLPRNPMNFGGFVAASNLCIYTQHICCGVPDDSMRVAPYRVGQRPYFGNR